jgi:hypothetical protein
MLVVSPPVTEPLASLTLDPRRGIHTSGRFFNSGSSVRNSYIWPLLSLNCLHAKARDFILSIVFLVASSLWSRTSSGVLDNVQASSSAILA